MTWAPKSPRIEASWQPVSAPPITTTDAGSRVRVAQPSKVRASSAPESGAGLIEAGAAEPFDFDQSDVGAELTSLQGRGGPGWSAAQYENLHDRSTGVQLAVEGQRRQVAGMELAPVGAVQQPGRTLRPHQRLWGDQPLPSELREQPADGLAMGAQHGVAEPPIPEQLQDLAGIGIHAESSEWFDRRRRSRASGCTVCWHRTVGLQRIRSTG